MERGRVSNENKDIDIRLKSMQIKIKVNVIGKFKRLPDPHKCV